MPDLSKVLAEHVLKPTATIHVGNKLSLIERKIFNAIIWHSQRNRFARQSDTLAIGLFMPLIGLERSKNMDVIKQALETLVTTPIVWNTLRRDRTTDWGICTFLAGAEISGGTLRYVMNPLLVEKVNNPTLFAKIQLLVQTHFSSKYSLALYEFLLDELGRAGSPEKHEVEASLDVLRHVLQFDGAYKHLNGDVLKPCVQEINRYADITVGYRSIKGGRAVVGIRFGIERSALQLQLDFESVEVLDGSADSINLPNCSSLLKELIDKGVSRSKAEGLISLYDETRIRTNIAHAEDEFIKGKVKNLPAFLVRAIENDYCPKKTPEEKRREEEAAQEHRRQEEKKAQELIEKEWKQYRARRARERFAALPEDEQSARQQKFIDSLQKSDPFVYGHYRRTGFKSAMLEARFFLELSDDLLVSPSETNLEAYLQLRETGEHQAH